MHASIDQLLSLRDGEPLDASVREHVGSCTECSAELLRLHGLEQQLRRLPQVPASHRGWREVEHRLARGAQSVRRRAVAGRFAAAASVAALGLVAGVRYVGPGHGPELPAPRPVGTSAAQGVLPQADSVQVLRARSAQLEEYLAALPERPAVERADMSLPIETLEAQVQWLDHQLSLAGTDDEVLPGTEKLWHDRVEVMNSLLQLRYVEAQRVAL